MAVASSSTLFFGVLSSPKNPKFHYLCKSKPFLLPLHPHSSPLTQPTLTFSVRKNNTNSAITSSSKKKKNSSSSRSSSNNRSKKKQSLPKKSNVEVVEDIDEDAIEALFNQLEEDLKSDGSFEDGDDDLTEEDLARLEKELKEAFGEDADLFEMLQLSEEDIQNSDDAQDEDEDEEEDEDDDDDDEEDESPVQLKNWQLRRLATALKIGRRKTSIKTLAAELCLDRAVVLELLHEPPPNLLMLSAALPDIVVPKPIEPEAKSTEMIVDVLEPSVEASDGVIELDPKVRVPVHATQSRWSAQKRLKKVQTETLERVYLRSKRPTNAMISSIVHVTNLPKKRVVEWFEDKRAEDGIAEDRLPYQRPTAETLAAS